MYQKERQELIFNKKRDFTLVTPCCNKLNKDGKFVNFKGYGTMYGYCHSCGTTSKPPALYSDEKGNYYCWNTVLQKFESVLQTPVDNVVQPMTVCNSLYYNKQAISNKIFKHIAFEIVEKSVGRKFENNLLQYLRLHYSNTLVDNVKHKYFLGTCQDRGTVFWFVNVHGKAQKAKISYYTKQGRRTNQFKVPFKNSDGYHACLYGEHLLAQNTKPIILVESEKTAIVASIEFPDYTWLAYSGLNGLTDAKLYSIKNRKILLIPDMSRNAVKTMYKKLPKFKELNIDATIFDMTKGKSDEELKKDNFYNCDIEDLLRLNFSKNNKSN